MRRLGMYIGMTVLLLAALCGCKRRPLEYYYRPVCRVVLTVDWSPFPEVPTGMTAFFYRDGDDAPIIHTTAEIPSTEVDLPAGHYRGFVINQSPSEFGTLGFLRMNDYYQSRASLLQTRAKWYRMKSETRDGVDDNMVSYAPENLGVAALPEFDITPEMVEEYQAVYAEWKTKTKARASANTHTKADSDPVIEVKERLDALTYYIKTIGYNVISELRVRVYIQGIYNLYSARASQDGLANDYLFSTDRTGDELAVELLESGTWKRTVYDADPTRGYIESSITTFGLPGGVVDQIASRDPSLNLFGLSCLLVDRTTQIDADFHVGNMFTIEEGVNGYRRILNLVLGTMAEPAVTLPDVPPYGEDDSGFDAVVSDWEEGETIEIPM